jgi:hypothetical protein
VAWRYDEAVSTCEEALALARAVGARPAEFLALRALGTGLAFLGRGDEGLTQLWLALRLAEERSDPMAWLPPQTTGTAAWRGACR